MPRRVRFHRIDPSTTGNLHARDTTLSPALGASLWEDCPILAISADPSIGTVYNQDFRLIAPATNAINNWTTTIATSGTVTADTTLGLAVDAGAVTAGQGINFQMASTPFAVASGKPVWFEGSVKTYGLSTTPKIQFLFGLAAVGTTLITSNAVGTEDKIAFAGVSTTGVMLANCTASATAGTGTGITLANATVYKLGFKATTTKVDFWVNGSKVSSLTANIPTTALAPALVVQGNATVTPRIYLTRLKVVGIN